MHIYLTDKFNSALETFRTKLAGYSEMETYRAARRVLNNVHVSSLDDELNEGIVNSTDLNLFIDTNERFNTLSTIDLEDISGYRDYLLGHIDPMYMPDDQDDQELEDAYVVYLALTITQIVTYHKVSGTHLK